MTQLLLFEEASSEQVQDSAGGRRRPRPQRSRGLRAHAAVVQERVPTCLVEPARAEPLPALAEALDPTEAARIVAALHARTGRCFRAALEPLLTDTERERITAAECLPYQLALVFDEVVERLTWRWARATEYAPFARLVEPGVQVRSNLRFARWSCCAPVGACKVGSRFVSNAT